MIFPYTSLNKRTTKHGTQTSSWQTSKRELDPLASNVQIISTLNINIGNHTAYFTFGKQEIILWDEDNGNF